MKQYGTLLRLSSGLVLFWILYWLFSKITRSQKDMNKDPEIVAYYLYEKALDAGFDRDTAKYVISQAAHETGNFTSALYKNNKNIFGMKEPAVRPSVSIGEQNGYADYRDIEDSITDFRLYYKYVHLPERFKSISEYVQALKEKNYFEDSQENYEKGVESFFKKYWIGNPNEKNEYPAL